MPEASTLGGKMQNTVSVKYITRFTLNRGVIGKFSYRFPVPTSYSYRAVKQKISRLAINVYPRPERIETSRDAYGNVYKTIHWKSVSGEVSVELSFKAQIASRTPSFKRPVPFPGIRVSRRMSRFLEESEQTRDSKGVLASLVHRVTAGSSSEKEAVEAILQWIQANIEYRPNTPRASAIDTYSRKYGNCEGYSNLAVAMLRKAGIPARVAGGISLSRKWRTPTKRGYITYDMGQGPHAWIEVYFPGQGWVPFDPQHREFLFPSRLIRFAHGRDAGEIKNTWRSDSYLPEYSEKTEAIFIKDKLDVRLK